MTIRGGIEKELIVLADGRNVFPEDVERALLAQPLVKEAAVVGVALVGLDHIAEDDCVSADDGDPGAAAGWPSALNAASRQSCTIR